MSDRCLKGIGKVTGRCREGVWKISEQCYRNLEDVCSMSGRFRKVSGRCLKVVWRLSGRRLEGQEGVWMVPTKRSDSVWKFSGTYLEDVWKV